MLIVPIILLLSLDYVLPVPVLSSKSLKASLRVNYCRVTRQHRRMDLRLSPEEDMELLRATDELLKLSKSLNPFDRFKASGLRDLVSTLYNKKDEERKARDEERRARDEETKIVSVRFDEDDIVGVPKEIDRPLFRQWSRDKATFYRNRKPAVSFDDLIPGEVYYVARNENFEGFSQAEGDIQTRDCVHSIMSNLSLVPPFGQQGTQVYMEIFEFYPPPNADISGLSFNFPIRPDALLVHGSTWLLLESKHAASNSHTQTFIKKRDFLWEHKNESWVHKKFPIPTKMIAVINSVKDFTSKPPPNVSSAVGDVLLFTRDELGYTAFLPPTY